MTRRSKRKRLEEAVEKKGKPSWEVNEEPSFLFEWIIGLVTWKNLSWPEAQAGAQAGMRDGLRNEELLGLAGLASHGHNPQNLWRDVKTNLMDDLKVPEPLKFEVFYEDPKGNKE